MKNLTTKIVQTPFEAIQDLRKEAQDIGFVIKLRTIYTFEDIPEGNGFSHELVGARYVVEGQGLAGVIDPFDTVIGLVDNLRLRLDNSLVAASVPIPHKSDINFSTRMVMPLFAARALKALNNKVEYYSANELRWGSKVFLEVSALAHESLDRYDDFKVYPLIHFGVEIEEVNAFNKTVLETWFNAVGLVKTKTALF